MATWPSGTKAGTTSTDADSDSISGARSDINQAITNQNAIIDTFNIGTPGAGDDDKVLTYDHSTGFIVLETATGGGLTAIVDDTSPQLGAPLQTNDQMPTLTNSDGAMRGDAMIIGHGVAPVNTGSSTTIGSNISSNFDIAGDSTLRIAGPIVITMLNDLNAWNNRVHFNGFVSQVFLTDDFGESGSGSERGKARIRNQYTELVMDTKGYQFGDFAFARFGDGLNGHFVSAKGFTSVDVADAHIHTIRGSLAAPQADGSDAVLTGSNRFTVNQMVGSEVSPFTDSVSDVNTVTGFKLDTSNINGSSTITTKYSVYSDDSDYVLYNAGPVHIGTFAYTALPTSGGVSAGDIASVSNAASSTNGTDNYQPAYYDGVSWRYVTDNSIATT